MVRLTSANNLEGVAPARAEPKHSEVVIESRSPEDTEPLHHRKARSVDDREVLIGKAVPDCESNLEICRPDRLDRRGTRAHSLPVTFRGHASDPVREKDPGLDQDVVASHQRFTGGENVFRAVVVAIPAVGGGVKDRRVDEERQRFAASTAPPR
jgi:hypothetical protein